MNQDEAVKNFFADREQCKEKCIIFWWIDIIFMNWFKCLTIWITLVHGMELLVHEKHSQTNDSYVSNIRWKIFCKWSYVRWSISYRYSSLITEFSDISSL